MRGGLWLREKGGRRVMGEGGRGGTVWGRRGMGGGRGEGLWFGGREDRERASLRNIVGFDAQKGN